MPRKPTQKPKSKTNKAGDTTQDIENFTLEGFTEVIIETPEPQPEEEVVPEVVEATEEPQPEEETSEEEQPQEESLDASWFVKRERELPNWRSLINEKFLYINEGFYNKRGIAIPESVKDAEDDGVVVRLIGLKDLATRHGYTSISYEIPFTDESNCVAKCSIQWSPTPYNNMCGTTTEGVASSNKDNTHGFAVRFKEAIASNRAFARAVRDYFGIFSVCEEELDESSVKKEAEQIQSKSKTAKEIRANKSLEANVSKILQIDTIEEFLNCWVKPRIEQYGIDESVLFATSYESISSDICRKLNSVIQKEAKEKGEA